MGKHCPTKNIQLHQAIAGYKLLIKASPQLSKIQIAFRFIDALTDTITEEHTGQCIIHND